jgi:hypothetical protein
VKLGKNEVLFLFYLVDYKKLPYFVLIEGKTDLELVLWIRMQIRSDAKLLAGSGYGSGKNHSGSGQRIRNEFEVKLL